MFRRFFYGRYGNDHLNLVIMVIALVIGVSSVFTHGVTYLIFALLQFCLLCLWFMRFLSKNHYARSNENQKFLHFWGRLREKFKGVRAFFSRLADRDHRYFKCPRCHSRLRVPRGRGNITVTCPRCRHRFDKKS